MKETSINHHFEVLGLKSTSTSEEIKETYKLLVKVWHPDRFTHDPKLQAKAQEKLKQINESFEKIKNYKPENYAPKREAKPRSPRKTSSQKRASTGEEAKSPPNGSAENKEHSESNPNSKEKENNESASQKFDENYTPFKVNQEVVKTSNNLFLIILASVIVIGLAVFFVYRNISQENKNIAKAETVSNKSPTVNKSINVAIHSNEQPIIENNSIQINTNIKQNKPSNSDSDGNSNEKVSESDEIYVDSANVVELKPQILQAVTPTPQTLVEQSKIFVQTDNETFSPKQQEKAVSNGYFTVGSTKDDVLSVQGTPKSIIGNTFGYDYSTVYFQNDRVTGWSNISRNLRVRMYSNSSTTELYFTVGSSKDDVIKIQGTPDSIIGNTFGYDYSTVYFQNNRVKSWSNISNNLKVIMKPNQ